MQPLGHLIESRVPLRRAFSPFYRARLAWRLPTLTRLALRLVRDPRVPRSAKVATLGAIGLVLSPVNLPGWVPVVGQAADLLVIAIVLDVFIRTAPRMVVREHVAALGLRPRFTV